MSFALCTAFTLAGPLAHAQADPAAQEVQRQQERERALRQQQQPSPDVRLQEPAVVAPRTEIPDNETPCFTIGQIALAGYRHEHFRFALEQVLADDATLIGRCLGARGIEVLIARVQNAIIAQGYVTTRVYARSQDIASGVLVLTVVPGVVAHIRFAEPVDPRATQCNAVPASPGDLLNLRDIEQGLENFKRLPTAEADIRIEAVQGSDPQMGYSDLVIQYQQAFPFRLTASIDNSGSEATGKYQGSITLAYDNWWTLNDLFYINYNHDLGGGADGPHGSRAYALHYSLPLGYWSLAFNRSVSDYHQTVAGAFVSYQYSGSNETTELSVSRVLLRNAVRKTSATLKAFLRTASNYIDDTEIDVQRRRTAGWEFGLGHKEFIGESTLETNLAMRHGTGMLSAEAAPEEAFGEGSSRFKLMTADLAASIPWTMDTPWGKQALRYSFYGRAQWNGTPLTPQDRFSIGSRYTVRGFDGENSLLAERGWFVRNDWAAALGASGQELYLGLDYGEVAGPSAQTLVGRHLAGAALGLRGRAGHVSYEAWAATPVSQPDNFKSATLNLGFTLSMSY